MLPAKDNTTRFVLGHGNFLREVNVLNCIEKLDALCHRPLESLAAGNEARATAAFVDDGRTDGIGEIAGAFRFAAGIDQTGASHVAIRYLIADEVDRMVG